MTNLYSKRAAQVLDWRSWCRSRALQCSDDDTRDYIARQWPDLDAEGRRSIFDTAEALAASRTTEGLP